MKKKTKEKSVTSLNSIIKNWKSFWEELNKTNILLVSFINTNLRVNQKIKADPLISQWEKLSAKAESFYDALEDAAKEGNHVDPIEIKYPWDDEKFVSEWSLWKGYLLEQHNISISSRVEQKQLDMLSKLSNNNEETALEMLNYSICNFYKMFFALDEKKEKKTVKLKNIKKDDDFS